jgi:hypothetical protein
MRTIDLADVERHMHVKLKTHSPKTVRNPVNTTDSISEIVPAASLGVQTSRAVWP